ncbi:MAG: hypothetical protein KDH20_19815 [Rhodocyclaceae bacterium]|nr:hypothetical protein [Rhodocyclaceae bacterium]
MEQRLWSRAMAEASGDESRARTLYIRARRDEMLGAAGAEQPDAPSEADDDGIDGIRARLVAALAESGKGSFYAILKLRPDASDEAVAQTIKDARQRGQDGSAELRYAIESLGHPDRRAAYDRRLHDQLVGGGSGGGAAGRGGYGSTDAPVGGGFRLFPHGVIALILVVAVGVFAMHLKEQARIEHEAAVALQQVEAERKAHEARQQAERLRLEQLRRRAAFEQEEAERIAKAQSEALAASREVLELERDVLKERRLAEEKIERQERARAQAETDALLAREEAERQRLLKVRKDKAYWSCLNKALNDMGRAEAQAKCEAVRDSTT